MPLALAIFIAVAFTMLGVLRALSRATQTVATATSGSLTLEAQIDAFRSEAATAFAVFVPDRDVFSGGNADGHEVDFYAKSDDGKPVFFAYVYDATAKTLTRYDYDTVGRRGISDRTTGAIDANGHYPALHGVTAFGAQKLFANQLVDRTTNPYGSVVAPLFAGPTPRPLPVGYDDGAGARADLYGGNMTVQIEIATERGSRTVHLATAALPSGFTVRAAPNFRVVIYRRDTTSKSFPFRSVSRIYIGAQLLVSYDDFKTKPIVWCDYYIFGYPEGLRAPVRGGVDSYHPDWFIESTAGVLYAVEQGNTPGAACPKAPPPPLGHNVARYSPPPAIVDTPSP